MNAVVVKESSLVAEPISDSSAASLVAVIQRAATDPNVDIDKMERLLQMHERIVSAQAKSAFQRDFAAMQPELPIVSERGGIKDRSGNVQSRYALWEDIVGMIAPVLSRHGFSLSFRIQNDASSVTVTGVLMHKDGHREESPMTLPMDTSGSKNAVQSAGSSVSYGKRYTAGALLNLRTGETDDDGRAAGSAQALISDTQAADIEALISEVGANRVAFLRYLKVERIEDVTAKQFPAAIAALRAKARA